MKFLVKQAMEESAVGLCAALEYVPASFAHTGELISLCQVVSKYDGMYISHVRNEDDLLLESMDELIKVAKEANVRAEMYHFKQVGKTNWGKFNDAVRKIDSARSAGLQITADMYNYTASSTGFDVLMPEWVQEGGFDTWRKRLQDPAVRKQVGPMILNTILRNPGSAKNILLVGFNTDSLKYLTGKTLAEAAELKKKSPEETVRKLTSLPAANLKISKRGALIPGYYADLVIFDPATIKDNATFEEPMRYATGMVHVFVNGVQVLKEGEHTGATPGKVVRGPGWEKKYL